jgi:type III secretion protein U
MAQDDSADKNEQPTDKRLRDAREKGDVAKSRELTSTLTLLAWLGLLVVLVPFIGMRLMSLTQRVFEVLPTDFSYSAPVIGWLALECVVWVLAVLLLPIVAVGLLSDFLQIGPVMSLEKVTPKLENLDPIKRIGQWFSMDQLMELVKSAVKTILMLFIAWFVLRGELAQFALLPTASAAHVLSAMSTVGLKLLVWTAVAFAFVSALDVFWQRHSFLKKQRMSIRDIRDEHKENEGDPMLKATRTRLHRELAEAQVKKMSGATALVVNPTHVAIALLYEKQNCPVPMVTSKGTDDIALEMRKAAEEHGIPIVRNIELARALLAECAEGQFVPEHHFSVVAEVVIWAMQVRREIDEALGKVATTGEPVQRRQAPGEDLTRYPNEEH